jgi:hypothetical protein
MPLQREFAGLADLVGLYRGGRVPLELDTAVTPTINALNFASRPKLAYATAVLAAVDANAPLPEVPTGKIWLCRSFGFSFTTPAGVTCLPEPVYEAPDNNFYGIQPVTLGRPFNNIPQSSPGYVGMVFADPFWMEAASNFAMKLVSYTGAAGITVNGFIQYHEIEI